MSKILITGSAGFIISKKAEIILGYKPEYDARTGFEKVAEWYWKNF